MIRRLALAIPCVLLLTGCGAKIDTDAVEDDIEAGILDQTNAHVTADCPDDIDLEVGGEFHCIVTSDVLGQTARVTVTMENDDGDITWAVDN